MPTHSLGSDPALAADFAACAQMIRQGSRSFYTASLVLPKWVRIPAYAIYAFCRMSDDAVDGPDAEADAVDQLMDRLNRAYAGNPLPIAADRAFAAVVRHFGIPKELPAALLEGLAWDAEGRRCETLSDLYAYSARVAGAVGAMMTVLMGVRAPHIVARACDLGVAMQLTNIARDIGEDARNGRLYLPVVWLEEAGIDPDEYLAAPFFDARIAHLVARIVDLADHLYRRSASGIAGLPRSCRPAIHAARLIYREIGHDVRRSGYDSVSRRAVVSDQRKLTLLAKATLAALVSRSASRGPTVAEAQFLVDAVPAPRLRFGDTILEDRIGFVLDLFGRLEARDKQAQQMAARSRNQRR
jgi:phytoene synthase